MCNLLLLLIQLRVAILGHNIPEDIIHRRYDRERKDFLQLYGSEK